MKPRYRVTLTEQEREELEALTRRGNTGAKRFIRARALLLCDAGAHGPAWTVADTAAALGVTSRTIEHLKKRFVEEGVEAALERKPREKPPREVVFDGAFEARLIFLACSDAPAGHRRWTCVFRSIRQVITILPGTPFRIEAARCQSVVRVPGSILFVFPHRVTIKFNFMGIV